MQRLVPRLHHRTVIPFSAERSRAVPAVFFSSFQALPFRFHWVHRAQCVADSHYGCFNCECLQSDRNLRNGAKSVQNDWQLVFRRDVKPLDALKGHWRSDPGTGPPLVDGRTNF